MHASETNNSLSASTFEAESSHLEQTLALVNTAIANTGKLVDNTETNYQDMKTYIVENRAEIDPSESFQNELLLNRIDQESAQALFSLDRMKKLLDAPYFAKIVFVTDEGEKIEAYIGRFSFNYENRSIISDWRSPVAGLFYDYDNGPAQYVAPSETIAGELKAKLQFAIENGVLLHVFDNASGVRDEILQLELSKTSDQKMKSIINTIQREQNQIIRDNNAGTLIIQGVAGSGKTSIALHRVAYLLYQHKDRLSSNSVAIISPNRVFSDYIANVLPELGEEPIREFCMQDLFPEVIDKKLMVEPARSFVDTTDEKWRERVRYKGTFEFMHEVLDYLEAAPRTIFIGKDVTFGRCTLEGPWIEERFYSYPNVSIEERLDLLVSDIILDLSSKIFSLGHKGMPLRSAIRTELKKMLVAKDALALYRKFYADKNKKSLFVQPGKQTIEWEDACPLVLFQGLFGKPDYFRSIEHMVIDEMQDLTPIQHYTINDLFACDKTILGDYHQMIDPENHMDLDSMQRIYPDSRLVKLTKSYRSTREIMELAKRVKGIEEIESVDRHGEEPSLVACGNTAGILEAIDTRIKEFEASDHKTLGILHKSEAFASRYHELLAQTHDIHLLTSESTSFEEGISISSIKMSKGLEFDEVIILDADKTQYEDRDDRNLLYVAITRAMHKLAILYRSELTSLLDR